MPQNVHRGLRDGYSATRVGKKPRGESSSLRGVSEDGCGDHQELAAREQSQGEHAPESPRREQSLDNRVGPAGQGWRYRRKEACIRAHVAIALRQLSRVAEYLNQVEAKIDDPERKILEVVTKIEARIRVAQEAFDLKWYEIDDEDRLVAMASDKSNMEF